MYMKIVILAGGFGTRISEESLFRPKPMIELDGKPVLYHILKHFASQGFNDFVICAGYKQYSIKDYFANRFLMSSDVSFDFTNGKNDVTFHKTNIDPWKVTVVDTGENTLTGGRISKIKEYLGDERFLVTYGDGLTDLKYSNLISAHEQSVREGNIATLTAVNVGQQFGVLDIDDNNEISNRVTNFREKANRDGGWVNAGYIVCEPEFFDYLAPDKMLEDGTLQILADKGLLSAYRHNGFWKAMDSMRDKIILENMIANNNAPWQKA